jgi:dienelactone hydrolase
MRTVRMLAVAIAWIGVGTAASAAVRTQQVEYRQGDTALQGFLAWDGAAKGKRPGVLVVHEWWGHNEHARNQARRLAGAGYVAFALDLYGAGKVATHPGDAEVFMKESTKDPAVLTARFNAARDRLERNPRVDPARIAAIGYCFGGAVVLGMARAGADLAAVVSFHGALATATPAEPGKVKARVLVLTGAEDPMIPPEQVAAFDEEMRAAGARFEVVSYPGARHSFTNPDAHRAGMEALAYNKEADEKSWAKMLELLGEVFPRPARSSAGDPIPHGGAR